jgi:hypothetical protein
MRVKDLMQSLFKAASYLQVKALVCPSGHPVLGQEAGGRDVVSDLGSSGRMLSINICGKILAMWF